MNSQDLLRLRLAAQRLHANPLEDPAALVRHMGAVQAQEYPAALWAVGQRNRRMLDLEVEQALTEKRIVRLWPMRGTMHLTAAEDARWITALCAPRILAAAKNRHLRDFDLDDAEFGRSREILQRALEGGRQLQRDEIFRALLRGGVQTAGQRGYHILWRLAQEGLLCYGPRRGKPQTFVLLEDWLPQAPALEGEAALVELAGRYFASHGPATAHDFAWWSGLPLREAQRGAEANRGRLEHFVMDGQTYWFAPPEALPKLSSPYGLLLPAFDEYSVGYAQRGLLLGLRSAPGGQEKIDLLRPLLVVDGRVRGTWKRTLRGDQLNLSFSPFDELNRAERLALSDAAERYAAHLGLSAQDDEEE